MATSARRVRGAGAALIVGAVLGSGALPAVAAPGVPGPAEVTHVRFFDAAVNVPPETPGAGGFVGGVRFHTTIGGPTTVDVYLSRQAERTCPDGAEGVAGTTLRTPDDEASEPGPVTLDVDRNLRRAAGQAVLDLLLETDPGCGEPTTTATLPARSVAITVVGTSERFFSGFGGGTSSGPDQQADLSYRFSRDGTGTLDIPGLLDDVSSDAAFAVYGVDRSRRHGTPPEAPASAAPPNGRGAQGFYAREVELAPGETGLVYEDAEVDAAVYPPPGRETVAYAGSLTVERVACPDGTTADVVTFVEGTGPATVTIPTSLSSATATASLELSGFTEGGCDGAGPSDVVVTLPAALELAATGPAVRVTSTRWHLTPGQGGERSHGWYVARPASGSVSVGAVGGSPDGATIARSGPSRDG